MAQRSIPRTRPAVRWKALLVLALLGLAGTGALAYAQTIGGSAFSLNSPVSFPVDI